MLGAVHQSLQPRGSKSPRALWHRFVDQEKFDFDIPDDLILVSCHNLDGRSLFDFQMERYAVPSDKYKVVKLNKEKTTPWSHFLRWKKIVRYFESDEIKDKEYILFCDATDVLFLDSPSNILKNYLKFFRCDLLYNATRFKKDYRWDRYTKEAMDHHNKNRKEFGFDRHLNSGLFIGRKDFIIEVYKKMLSYEFDSKGERNESTWGSHPEFPYGCAYDQQVLRYMEHEYYPRLQIDGFKKLFVRRG